MIRAGESVCCGGAINSPQLLRALRCRSSILLEQHDIPVVADLPGVGENLEDHAEVYVQYACTQPVSLYPALKWWRKPWIGAQWLFGRRGTGATNHFEAGGFIRSNDTVSYPNVQYHFLPIAIRYNGTSALKGHGYQVHVGPVRSDVRGHVRIRSTDPTEHPRSSSTTSPPSRTSASGSRPSAAPDESSQPGLAPFRGDELAPGPDVQTDEKSRIVRRELEAPTTELHCKMGSHPMAVTTPDLRVHGLQGLRVVDASVMPAVTNGNIYAPVLMIAEKADIIQGKTPLDPVDL